MRSNRWLLELAAVLAVAAGAVVWAYASRTPVSYHGRVMDPVRAAPDFALTDQQGRPFRLSSQRGSAILLFFGYTSCPDVCPTTLSTFRQVRQALGSDAEQVRFVFVTVDPERDTPERLREYLAFFDPSVVGLWGELDALETVREAYGVYAAKSLDPQAPDGYWMNHTATAFLVDASGNLRLSYSFGTPAEDIAADVRQVLR
ncbi:SCO family protein [Limnochorda pilosa]|uniref:Electron transport protein SCO1/SenC n=1 Tax=Limnochorda pilosa TaxID=1555112 RepID=A0A0K2SQB6_LIMPI|nr:SCO family protein [Limnochorda pilosa]BAS29182.1 electron transport protein SCO1/SenC [Limnochorda pilosa]